MLTFQIPPLAISNLFIRSQAFHYVSPVSPQDFCSVLCLGTAHSWGNRDAKPTSGGDLIKNFPSYPLGHRKGLLTVPASQLPGESSAGWNWGVCDP